MVQCFGRPRQSHSSSRILILATVVVWWSFIGNCRGHEFRGDRCAARCCRCQLRKRPRCSRYSFQPLHHSGRVGKQQQTAPGVSAPTPVGISLCFPAPRMGHVQASLPAHSPDSHHYCAQPAFVGTPHTCCLAEVRVLGVDRYAHRARVHCKRDHQPLAATNSGLRACVVDGAEYVGA